VQKVLTKFENQLCDIQGRLFERSFIMNLDSKDFIEKFMNSETCRHMDLSYDRLQWAGEEYIPDYLLNEINIDPKGIVYKKDELYWAGYIYRYWHYLTGESGRRIYSQIKAPIIKNCYLGFHTLDNTLAVENLKEIHRQKMNKMN